MVFSFDLVDAVWMVPARDSRMLARLITALLTTEEPAEPAFLFFAIAILYELFGLVIHRLCGFCLLMPMLPQYTYKASAISISIARQLKRPVKAVLTLTLLPSQPLRRLLIPI